MPKDFSPYQQKVIRNYYANREAIQGQSLADLVFPAQQLCFLIGRGFTRKQADGLEQQQARRHPQELRHLLWVRHLPSGDLRQVRIRHFRERYLEDVELFAFNQREEKLERPFEHRRLDVESRTKVHER